MFYDHNEYTIIGGQFIVNKTNKPMNPGDMAAIHAYSEPDDISGLETYGKEIVAQNRELVEKDGKTQLCKVAIVRI